MLMTEQILVQAIIWMLMYQEVMLELGHWKLALIVLTFRSVLIQTLWRILWVGQLWVFLYSMEACLMLKKI